VFVSRCFSAFNVCACLAFQKCEGPKRKPLEREFPHICRLLEPLSKREDFCLRNNWAARRSVSARPEPTSERRAFANHDRKLLKRIHKAKATC
jgi:hypothetical protein